jgi:hypothetical protein
VPLTFFAHQSVVLPLKMTRPQWFDATALCIGAMAPDLAYALTYWLAVRSHRFIGFLVWAWPFGILGSIVVRRIAATVFAHLPDFGPLRVHSLRVLGRRKPRLGVTIVSAAIGAGSHIVLDGFTHKGRFGSRWLGFDRVLFTVPVKGEMTISRVFQYFGHTVGSVIGLLLLAAIARRHLLDDWYGEGNVADARRFSLTTMQRLVFWVIVACGLFAAVVWPISTEGSTTFRVIDGLAATTLLASLIPFCRSSAKVVDLSA